MFGMLRKVKARLARPGPPDRHICEDLQRETSGTMSRKDRGVFDRKRLLVEASAFIESQNVTHYFTLTYPRRRSWEGRYKSFLEWIDGIEWMQHRPLGWLRADECRFSGCGFPEIPEHHHGVLVDTQHLSCRTAEGLWRTYGDALVERYEPHGGAIEYCLKHALDTSEWSLGGKALKRLPLFE